MSTFARTIVTPLTLLNVPANYYSYYYNTHTTTHTHTARYSTSSSSSASTSTSESDSQKSNTVTTGEPSNTEKSVVERDKEIQEKFKERYGGSESEVFEDGKPEEGLRREVKRNMFRLI
ncbi:hypothetical protein M422DRAFT_28950 [Sphaerobolus stellatus SS14]|nr:hypothetical protein M422DRAFT_28950 [Sphaerobolus stellatus SS14]